jgi:hypothetical protein
MSKRRMSMKGIYDSLFVGSMLTEEQHDFLAVEVHAGNMENVTWQLLTNGKHGYRALQQLFFNTELEEVRDHCESIFQEKQAEPAMQQKMDRARYPAIADVCDRALVLGSRYREAKSLVMRGATPQAALSCVYG